MADEKASVHGSWKYRRRFMIGVTVFICAFMVFTVIRLGDTPTTVNAITMGLTTITGIVGS